MKKVEIQEQNVLLDDFFKIEEAKKLWSHSNEPRRDQMKEAIEVIFSSDIDLSAT